MAEKTDFIERLRTVIDRLGTRREAALTGGVSLDAVIRYLRGENQPSFAVMARLCERADMSLDWLATGQGAPERHAAVTPAIQTLRGLPVSGFAETRETGWYTAHSSSVQTTLDLPDPQAFATLVHGQGLIPEGLQPGFLCICSPMLRPVAGDIVHLTRFDGLCTLKLFEGEEGEWLLLKAYTDADGKGLRRPYEDRVKRSSITQLAPVVFIRRRV